MHTEASRGRRVHTEASRGRRVHTGASRDVTRHGDIVWVIPGQARAHRGIPGQTRAHRGIPRRYTPRGLTQSTPPINTNRARTRRARKRGQAKESTEGEERRGQGEALSRTWIAAAGAPRLPRLLGVCGDHPKDARVSVSVRRVALLRPARRVREVVHVAQRLEGLAAGVELVPALPSLSRRV